jgi:hypothetical protein
VIDAIFYLLFPVNSSLSQNRALFLRGDRSNT